MQAVSAELRGLAAAAAVLPPVPGGRGGSRQAGGGPPRGVPVLPPAARPYARSVGGIGGALGRPGLGRCIVAVAIAGAVCVEFAGRDGAVLFAAVGAVTVAAALLLRCWLGGITGDALGAA